MTHPINTSKSNTSKRIADLFSQIVSDLIPDALAQFTKLENKAVDGTDKLVVVAELDAAALDAKLRAALRAGGFELAEWNECFVRHDVSPVAGLDAATVGPKGAGVNSAPQGPVA